MTVPILQCEIAPSYAHGMFVSIEYLCLNTKYTLSAWVRYAFFFALPSEISLNELPIGEIGGKDGLSGVICGCRLSRVFGM